MQNNNNNNNKNNNNPSNNRELCEIKSNLLLEQALKTQEIQSNYLGTLQSLVNQYNSVMCQQQNQFQQETKLIDSLTSLLNTNHQNIILPTHNYNFITENTAFLTLPPPTIVNNANNCQYTLPPFLPQINTYTIPNIPLPNNNNNNNNNNLLQHLNDININDKKTYKCNKCCKSFSRLGNLKNHQRTHDSNNNNNDNDNDNDNDNNNNNNNILNKAFICEECNKSFRNRSGLSNHRIIHNGMKPHKCAFLGCGKAFARSCDLTRHTRLHTGDKPFKCKYKSCKKSFTRSVQLRLHLMDHTGQRPFKCDICKKGFKTLQNAQIHMRIHTGEKPYGCHYCKKRFTQSSSLKTHLSSIHKN